MSRLSLPPSPSLRFAGVVLLALALAAPAAAQMPDVAQMSGMPLPTGDLPTGTVSVRVVRGDLSNNAIGVPVELHGGAQTLRLNTDQDGRAQFTNLAPGSSVHAMAVVDGQQLESQTFVIPQSGGIRTILVARGAAGSGPASAPPAQAGTQAPPAPSAAARPGTVTLGGQSRFVFELADEAIDVYYLLDIVNPGGAPVSTEPLVFELPGGARGATVLEGSSPQARADGPRVQVEGPFAPGVTSAQFAYQLPYSGGDARLRQRLPAALSATSLAIRKIGDMRVSAAQAPAVHEMTSDNNRTYIVATGGPIEAGGTLDVAISGLPHHSPWPRYLALACAALIAAAGVWLSLADDRSQAEARVTKLQARREQLLADLVRLDEQRLLGRGEEGRTQGRRDALVAQLEQVYAQLENAGTVLNPPNRPGAAGARAQA